MITLTRSLLRSNGTFGVLSDDKGPLCVTLELPWKDNQRAISCVPPGLYHCARHDSRAHPNTWELWGVPDRADILLHTGNTILDTRGCILVGNSFGRLHDLPAVLNSGPTMNYLRGVLPAEFDLTIQ